MISFAINFVSASSTNLTSSTNTVGNKLAVGALLSCAIFSLIVSIVIIIILRKIRQDVFKTKRILNVEITEGQPIKQQIIKEDPKLKCYTTKTALVVLLVTFIIITIVFCFTAFSVSAIENSSWGIKHVQGINKAFVAVPIVITIVCFIAMLCLSEMCLKRKKCFSSSNSLNFTHQSTNSHVIHKECIIHNSVSWIEVCCFIINLLGILICVTSIILGIYGSWAFFAPAYISLSALDDVTVIDDSEYVGDSGDSSRD